MKFTLIALTLSMVAGTSANATGLEFTGDVSMGLIGGETAGAGQAVRTFTNLDAEARLTFEISGSVTVGLVVPVQSDDNGQGLTLSVTH